MARTGITYLDVEKTALQLQGQGKLPQALQTLVTGLWEQLQADAEGGIIAIQQTCSAQLQALQDSLRQKQQENVALEKQFEQATEVMAQASLEKKALQEQLQQLQKTHTQL